MVPFSKGNDQELQGPRYGLVGVYTVPAGMHGEPLPQELAELRLPRQQAPDPHDDTMDPDVQELPQEDQSELPELPANPQEDLSEAEARQQEVCERKWKEFLEDRRAQAVKNLTFAVPLKSRGAEDLNKAVTKIFVRAKAMGLPIQRVHTDRAKEFAGRHFQKRLRDHDLYHTMNSGAEPQGNGRAEREVREIKGRMRTLLAASKAPVNYWPLALRHAGEQRLRRQLANLGITTPQLLPFGPTAMSKQKTWQTRDDPLKHPMQKVRLWGPAADMAVSSLGYYVEGENGRFFRSTVVKVYTEPSAGRALGGEQQRVQDRAQDRLQDQGQQPQDPGQPVQEGNQGQEQDQDRQDREPAVPGEHDQQQEQGDRLEVPQQDECEVQDQPGEALQAEGPREGEQRLGEI